MAGKTEETSLLAGQGLQQISGASKLVHALFRQRWKFLIATSMTFLAALLWTFLTPKQFESEMVLLVQNARGAEVMSPGQGGVAPVMNDVSEEQLNSEVAVLNSTDVLREVIDPGSSTGNSSIESSSSDAELERETALRRFRAHLDVSSARTSHIIVVKLDDSSPSAARSRLTLLLQAFLRKQEALGRLPGASEVFSQQAARLQGELQAARAEFADYQRQHGFFSLDSHEGDLSTKASELDASLRGTDAEIDELRSRAAADQEQLASLPERQTTTNRTLPSTQTIDQLNVLLVTLRNKRTELLTKLRPEDRLVKEVDQQILDTAAGLSRVTSTAPAEVSTDINPTWLAAQHDLSVSVITEKGLQAKRNDLQSQLDRLRGSLAGVEQDASGFLTAQQHVQELEERYRTFVQRRDQSQMGDLMDRQQWLNVAVVENPTYTLHSIHPKPLLDISLGLATAFLVGGCAIVLFESTRQQVSTPAELDEMFPYPVLATIAFAPNEPGSKRILQQPTIHGALSQAVPDNGFTPTT